MASARLPGWKRALLRLFPFLFKQCPGYNMHWRTDQVCYCRCGEYCGDWHGGIYDFSTGLELHVHVQIDRKAFYRD